MKVVMSAFAIENEMALGIRHKENMLVTKWYLKKLRICKGNIFSKDPSQTLLWEYSSCVQKHIQFYLEEADISSSFPFPAKVVAMWLICYTSLLAALSDK